MHTSQRFTFRLIFQLCGITLFCYIIYRIPFSTTKNTLLKIINENQRTGCTCQRRTLPNPQLTSDNADHPKSLCNDYATRRGPHQRVIAISLFGPKENKLFLLNRTLTFLDELIQDFDHIYPDNFTLRVYHDETISTESVVCPIECQHANVDFCNIAEKKFIPPKIWRFIPAGDPLVDISE